MRILLAHNSLYYPSHGGGDKSNRLLMEALAARGHEVRVTARIEHFGEVAHVGLITQLAARGVDVVDTGESVRFRLNGVDVRALTRDNLWRGFFARQIEDFSPDVIVCSTDDPAQLLLDLALKQERARVVYLVRAMIPLPFGPDASSQMPARTRVLRQADKIVCVSEYVADYVRRYSGLDAVYVPISLMETTDPPHLGRFDNRFVTMVNPCAVKGIAVFLALARRFPQADFAAVPTWGATAADYDAMRELKNVSLVGPYDQVDDLLAQTRVMLVPSLWGEARSRMVVESLMRGVPVLGADVGGIPEAMCGVDYLLPVNPIRVYKPAIDENMVPVAEVPPQDMGPWEAALGRLLTEQTRYEALSRASREASLAYARSLSAEPFERVLIDACARPRRQAVHGSGDLSAERRRLLALRLRQKAARPADALPEGGVRLYAFPFAGGSALSWRGLAKALDTRLRLTAVALPAVGTVAEMIEPLAAGIDTGEPYALFGHSMGAGIAFEVARRLRDWARPGPRLVALSSARAPQFRVAGVEATDEELLAELRRLGGLPDDQAVAALFAPGLLRDVRRWRNHVYVEAEPIDAPVLVIGGEADPQVSAEQLDGWAAETRGGFERRLLPGGHFYFQESAEGLAAVLAESLR